jgi:hypothetical protein
MAEYSKAEILKSLYDEGALPQDKMDILKSLEDEGQLSQGLEALSNNQQFISSLSAPQPQTAPPSPTVETPQKTAPPSPTVETPQIEQEKGVGDYLNALWEGWKGGASMGVQAAAVPVSGMFGLAKTITSGPEAGAKTIEDIQSAAANLIPAKPAEEAMGKVVEAGMKVPGVTPVVETAMKVPETIGDLSYEGALKLGLSPETATYFGAAGKSALPVAIELLGLKGTSTAKKGLFKNIIKKAEKTDFYDEFGALKPEMKTALKEANIGLDEVSDVLPETITSQKAAQPIATQIKKGKMGKLAESFQPDIDKIKAFEDLDIDYLPQHVSNNPTAKAIAENLKDIPGSLMDSREKKIIQQISDKADEIIIKGGGTVEKGELATRYVDESNNIINSLAKESNKIYDEVGKAIPAKTPAATEKIMEVLKSKADDLGGEQYLSPKERQLIKTLDPGTKPTYGRLDLMRRQIGEQLGGKDTPFRNVDRKSLGELYDAMTNDQETSILRQGNEKLLETYLTGKYLVAQRKGIEKQLQNVLGKKITGDVTKKMGLAVKGLANGNTMTFDRLLSDIPKELGKDMRRDLVTSALNDAFLTGARGKDKLSIGGFGSYWKKINRQPKAMKKLKDELSPETWKRLNTLATVNDALKSTMELSVRTGRQLSTPGLFDEVNNIAARAYGLAKKAGARTPGVGRIFEDIAKAPKNARSIAADELLTDRKFQNILRQQAMGKVKRSGQITNMNKFVENLKSYKKWKKTLPEGDLADLATVGALGYFTGKQEKPAK